jgi:hypothetical protein
MYLITNAYDISPTLRDKGGKYDKERKGWLISDETYAKLDARGPACGMAWARGWAKAVKSKQTEA